MIGNFEFNVDCAERGASCTAGVWGIFWRVRIPISYFHSWEFTGVMKSNETEVWLTREALIGGWKCFYDSSLERLIVEGISSNAVMELPFFFGRLDLLNRPSMSSCHHLRLISYNQIMYYKWRRLGEIDPLHVIFNPWFFQIFKLGCTNLRDCTFCFFGREKWRHM